MKSQTLLRRVLWGWGVLTLLGALWVYDRARIEPAPMPDPMAQRWALAALDAVRTGLMPPPPPAQALAYRAAGPVIALGWYQGRVRARYVGDRDFAGSVQRAAAAFAQDAELTRLPGFAAGADNPVRFTLTIVRGTAPLLSRVPLLSNLGLVASREGALAELDGAAAYLGPDELLADELFEHVRTPIPDLRFGVDLPGVEQRLAAALHVDRDALLARGRLRRFVAGTIAADAYPSSTALSLQALEQAAREGAEFLLRHQQPDGRYTYLYRGHLGDEAEAEYNLPRHAGTTYFLAQAARVLDMPSARQGALSALRWLSHNARGQCGAADRLCIHLADAESANMGSAALTALAASELLRGGDDPEVRALLVGLNAFIRAQQRPDGELMHEYDLIAQRPVDVQRMYFSGEAADALFASQRVLSDPRDRAAAQRVMQHLTGAAWDFFGSRYYYGEEHWTCQAAAQAARLSNSTAGIDFCVRWLDYQRVLQFRRGQTPWPVEGAIGVSPVLVPRLTGMASRMEAATMLYPVLRDRGYPVEAMRELIESGLGLILRMRWGPGPTHLLFDPKGAQGGVPGSFVSLESRNDFVQHACSALLTWVEVLRDEASRTPLARSHPALGHGTLVGPDARQ